MVGGGRVVDGSDGNHNHIEYGVSEYQQVDGDQGKNKGCEPSSMTPSGIKGGQQQVKTSKSAVHRDWSCIPDEGFRSRERDFQMHVLESCPWRRRMRSISLLHRDVSSSSRQWTS
eukprot:jgi/Picre1/34504/NNA_001972.t1